MLLCATQGERRRTLGAYVSYFVQEPSLFKERIRVSNIKSAVYINSLRAHDDSFSWGCDYCKQVIRTGFGVVQTDWQSDGSDDHWLCDNACRWLWRIRLVRDACLAPSAAWPQHTGIDRKGMSKGNMYGIGQTPSINCPWVYVIVVVASTVDGVMNMALLNEAAV